MNSLSNWLSKICIEVEKLLAELTFITTSAKHLFDVADENDKDEEIEKCRKIHRTFSKIYSRNSATSSYSNASTPTSSETKSTGKVHEFPDVSSSRTNSEATENLKQVNKLPQKSNIMDETRETVSQVNEKDQFIEEDEKEVGKRVRFKGEKDVNNKNVVPEISASMVPPLPPIASTSSIEKTGTPSPPTIPLSQGLQVVVPPPIITPQINPLSKGVAPPPPPPLSLVNIVRLKRVASKLKRSSQMGNLYRLLKGKLEGSSLKVRSSSQTITKVEGSHKGTTGMAEALSEITKRSYIYNMSPTHALTTIFKYKFIRPFIKYLYNKT